MTRKRLAGRPDHIDRVNAEYIAARVRHCPECEVVCYQPTGAPLLDLPPSTPWDLMPEWFGRLLLTHGRGCRPGRAHECLPAGATLIQGGE